MSNIHPQAVVESGANIGNNVTVEAFAVVKRDVTLHDDVVIMSHAYVDGHTTIGEGSVIYPGASIGTKSQDRKFTGEKTFVRIGKHCQIREFVTINSSCGEGTAVEVGDYTMIMAYCHVAHNCVIGSHVTLSNGINLAGHVTIEDYASVGGMTGVHQRVRIGCYAMVGGMSPVTHDIPPYTLGRGAPYKLGGLNLIGLKRRDFAFKTRQLLARCYLTVYRSGLSLEAALQKIEAEVEMIPEVQHWVDFCRQSERGLISLNSAGETQTEKVAQIVDHRIATAGS